MGNQLLTCSVIYVHVYNSLPDCWLGEAGVDYYNLDYIPEKEKKIRHNLQYKEQKEKYMDFFTHTYICFFLAWIKLFWLLCPSVRQLVLTVTSSRTPRSTCFNADLSMYVFMLCHIFLQIRRKGKMYEIHITFTHTYSLQVQYFYLLKLYVCELGNPPNALTAKTADWETPGEELVAARKLDLTIS